MIRATTSILAMTIAGLSLPAFAQQDAPMSDIGILDDATAERAFGKRSYSPYVGQAYPTRVFWGDTHLHTALSVDSTIFGSTLQMEPAYRFARGEEVMSSTGLNARLSRPLDFLVVADHAEGLGSMVELFKGNPLLLKDPTLKRWAELFDSGPEGGHEAYTELNAASAAGNLPAAMSDPALARSVWDEYVETADRFNEPGRFTALIGYEWSSNARTNNLHRVVVYRDDAERTRQMLPFSAEDSENPEDLWKALQTYEDETGGQVLAIPHNGNLSGGMMFDLETFEGEPLTQDWVETRARWEPLYEITQMKGDSEAHPLLSPTDEFADYETWDDMTIGGNPTGPENFPREYARPALKNGLALEEEFGTNPFKYGFIGSTDSHTSLAAVEEDNFFGKHPGLEPSAERLTNLIAKVQDEVVLGWKMVASGYAGVWATENTREALWDAMKRKEVYGTTGPRMLVRFFGGWDFTEADASTRRPAEVGYEKGVPMGGDLSNAPEGKSPTFLIAALKDPIGANLDRYQIVKGWMDAEGALHEKVYDVVWGGDRQPGSDGKLPPVGITVDMAAATWTNTIGATELITVWEDPDFDPAQKAFYYGRVIEIPTPRWTAYDAKFFGLQNVDPEVQMIAQERAYTSPIWYTPN
ncbi:DUF3604 domain-containing protein [Aliiruegeria sabulilitoris]|uniref:DUF3604 domain-containing protein n=1 Tax=Aliiruegeria sabulilitoris TaxID=1510458 RepID=UPI0008308F33|nr:DUF3604 domain-containing protein [Aliiruegeria sabulilitoris]NDR57945.1 DUF3604 domain-containing protein [Pseudoruegeria sp. M32A2M]